MTSEPPRAARRNRPDPSFRRRALAADRPTDDRSGSAPGPRSGGRPPANRESLRDALSRIPDIATEPPAEAAPTPAPARAARPVARPARSAAPGSSGPGSSASARVDQPAAAPAPAPAAPPAARPVPVASEPDDLFEPDPDELGALGEPDDLDGDPPRRARRTATSPRPPAPRWRRVVFAVALVGLVGSIPVLANTGYRLVTESTDGKEGKGNPLPTDPGYEQLVTSTPTAVVVQTDANGSLVGATFLSLGAESGGGSVIFLPVDTLTPNPAFGIDRLRSSYEFEDTDPAIASDLVVDNVSQILNVGVDEIIQLDDEGWQNLVAPVAPFAVDNLDSFDLLGTPLRTGEIELPAELAGPYLGARQYGEDELARISRQEQVWKGWLAAVAASSLEDKVPGESGTGMGRFARTLAEGDVSYATLPGSQVPNDGGYQPDVEAVKSLVADAVPAPDAALPGSRQLVRLLNGVSGDPQIPSDLLRKVAALDGSVTVVGNGPSFGQEQTSIVYRDPADKDYAELLKVALGATGEVTLDRAAPDTVDLTVVFGADVLGEAPVTTTTVEGAPVFTTASTTTPAPGGN